jgi:hypothetical protein
MLLVTVARRESKIRLLGQTLELELESRTALYRSIAVTCELYPFLYSAYISESEPYNIGNGEYTSTPFSSY